MSTLLAKGRSHGELTLQQHLLDTEQAAVTLFKPGTRWGGRWPGFCRLEDADQFLRELRVAALFHDIGKANEDFQRAVAATSFAPQTLRHEHLSALVMSLPEVRAWLSGGSVDADLCTAAVLSHHLKASEDGLHRWGQFTEAPSLRLSFDDPQVVAILRRIATLLGSPAPTLPTGTIQVLSRQGEPTTLSAPWGETLAAGQRAAVALRRALRRDPARCRRLVALKVGLIVSDAVASGLFRVGESIESWVELTAHSPALGAEEVWRDILQPRLTSIGKGRPAELHSFQRHAAAIGPRGLLLAPCGAGKTLAAWAWAGAQAKTHPLARVIFLYPTRGTATEGFRDYVAWAPEGDAALLHGTAEYELERMRENPPEANRNFGGPSEVESRLYALGLWSKRYFSATVDQFLSALEHRYEAMCLLPALADSAVIIDEVHSFDRRMFKTLVTFLREFDVPTLCMTATLPSERRRQLEEVGLRTFPTAEDQAQLEDLVRLEHAPRYRLRRVAAATEALAPALAAYRDGKRVLWVVNRVARAQQLAQELSQQLGAKVLCYHSRFRLMDRQAAHQRTVAAFQQANEPVIAVTTQVCEMSLDLDADVLVTEECPVTSLVQRFGRSNRHLRRPGVLAEILTYPNEESRPYSPEDLLGVGEFLTSLDGRDFCQAELAEAIESLASNETRVAGESSALFTSGYFAVASDFRDIEDFSRPAVLDSDLELARAHLREHRSIAGLIVPVPRQFLGPTRPGLPTFLSVADGGQYSAELGFLGAQQGVA